MTITEPSSIAPSTEGRLVAGSGRRAGSNRSAFAMAGGVFALGAFSIHFAPEPPTVHEGLRWGTIAIAVAVCLWNCIGAYRAYRSVGFLSIRGLFHAWCFFAFSYPLAEITYRYRSVSLGLWQHDTGDPLFLKTAVVLAVFQVVFFTALGPDPSARLKRFTASCKGQRVRRGLALGFVSLALPLWLVRIRTLEDLGLAGTIENAVQRAEYLERLSSHPGALEFILHVYFPIYAVLLLCLAVKFGFPHPSTSGRLAFSAVLLVSAAGVVVSGGRAELVYVTFAVILFMVVQGYRGIRDYKTALLPLMLVFITVILVGQARHGGSSPLTRLAGGVETGAQDYSSGDLNQFLGVGRADVVAMILDRGDEQPPLDGRSYRDGLAAAANSTFIPRMVLGRPIGTWRISDQILGIWIFNEPRASALPSTPGELLLNFGLPGMVIGALLLGLLFRFGIRWVLRFAGSSEALLLLTLWLSIRLLSDESFLIFGVAGSYLPLVGILTIALVPRRSSKAHQQRVRAAGV